MTLFRLALAFIRRRPGVWALQVLILAFGIGLITTLLLLERGVERRLTRDLGGVDLVVGAKGSPLQIVLSSLFAMDTPTGNIPLAQAEAIAHNPMVAEAVPVSIGDNVGGFRIVGTSRGYASLYGAHLATGDWWHAPLEAVAGATVAHRLGLRLNSTFVSEHGLSGGEAHRATPYRLVGIMRPSGSILDRLVLTDTSSVWRVHEGELGQAPVVPGLANGAREPQITSLLIKYRSAMGAVMLPQIVSARPDLQAASPAVEMRRLARAVGIGADVVRGIALSLLLLAACGFVVNLWSTIEQRRPELALLRVLGASRGRLISLICLEASILGIAGSLLGLALGRATVTVLNQGALRYGAEFSVPPLSVEELSIAIGGVALAIMAGLPAAFLAGYSEPARELVHA